jgi:hypothetical protein
MFSRITTVGSRQQIGISREGLHGSGGSAAPSSGGEVTIAATGVNLPHHRCLHVVTVKLDGPSLLDKVARAV